MNKISVLFISRAFGQHAGGMERLSFEFLQALQNHTNFTVSPITHNVPGGQPLIITRLTSILFTLRVIPKALHAARKSDVVYLGDPLLSVVGWLIQKLYKKPVTITVHGLDVSYGNPLYRLYLSAFFRNFALYLPISKHAATLLSKWHPSGKVIVTYPGITDQYYDPTIQREKLVELLHLPSISADTKVVCTVGRLISRKGHAWFVEHVLPKLPKNYVYVIAGEGSEETIITQAAIAANVKDRTILLGKVDSKTLQILYNTVDFFIQPNIPQEKDAEGFGLVLLEAALCGRCVIASHIDGISDAIHDGKNGVLLPSQIGDAWVKTIMNPQCPNDPRGYTLSTFNWQYTAKSTAIAIEQIL